MADVFTVLGESAEPRHLCQTVVSLWDVHKLDAAPGPLPADDYSRLIATLLRRADDCDDLGLVCALYRSGGGHGGGGAVVYDTMATSLNS